MRLLAVLGVLLTLGAVASACAFWAGASQGAALAVALGGSALAVGIPVVVGQLDRWGVPGDGPSLMRRGGH